MANLAQKKIFTVIGGDLRQAHLANALASREGNYKIYAMFLARDIGFARSIHISDDVQLVLPQSDIVVLPLPLLDARGNINTPLSGTGLEFSHCLDYISPEATVFAGKVPPEAKEQFDAKGIVVVDYLKREDFAVMNAIPTAEGAVNLAMQELPVTLFGSTCIVTGYGRISKVLAKLLAAFGAHTIVIARKYEDLAWARTAGCEAVHISEMKKHLPRANVLFNTVPAMLLGEEKLKLLGRDCLVIDLASKPGGVDFETAQRLGIKAIWALSLPGKVAPVTAGEITLDTILNILCERGT